MKCVCHNSTDMLASSRLAVSYSLSWCDIFRSLSTSKARADIFSRFFLIVSELFKNVVLTRALEGGAKNALPSGFSRIAEKRRRAAPPFFQYLLTIEFHTLCENFNPRSPKVRSPGQVKVKNGFLTLRLRSGHTRYPIGFKPSAFHKVIDTYNLYISDF